MTGFGTINPDISDTKPGHLGTETRTNPTVNPDTGVRQNHKNPREPKRSKVRTKTKQDKRTLPELVEGTDLDTPKLREVLAQFEEYREGIKAPLSGCARKLLLTKLKGHSGDEIIEAVQRTILSGKWTGVFFRDDNNGGANRGGAGNGRLGRCESEVDYDAAVKARGR